MPFRDPDRRRAYQRERAQLRRAGKLDAPAKSELSAPVRIDTAHDLLDLLEEQLDALRNDRGLKTVERARTVGALVGVTLRALEIAGLEDRLRAVENVLAQRTRRR